MDPLGDVLDGVRARSASFCRVALQPPWALTIADDAALGLATTVRGEAWLVPEDGEPARMRPGAVAVVQGTVPFTIADDPATEPTVVVGPGNVLRDRDGHEVPVEALESGPGDPERATILVSGAYQVHGDVGRRLLDVLPRELIVHDAVVTGASDAPVSGPAPTGTRGPVGHGSALRALADELETSAPAQQVMLDRLLDVALIETLRAWFASPGADPPGWVAAHSDPVVGPALQRLHSDPATDWTLDRLARTVGASRATLARRFRALVGEPPMAYLTTWRITRAADLLRSTDLTVDAIAHQVGYANGFALSVAFQRLRGIRPSDHRAGHGPQIVTSPAATPPRV